ncbi:unnamed protein product [Lampetra planeri]
MQEPARCAWGPPMPRWTRRGPTPRRREAARVPGGEGTENGSALDDCHPNKAMALVHCNPITARTRSAPADLLSSINNRGG